MLRFAAVLYVDITVFAVLSNRLILRPVSSLFGVRTLYVAGVEGRFIGTLRKTGEFFGVRRIEGALWNFLRNILEKSSAMRL